MKYSAWGAVLLLAACGGSARTPSAAVRALDEAARDGDLERVMKLIGPQTRARLEVDARLAGEQAGRRRVSPSELLAVGWRPPRFSADEVREVARAGDEATVEVRGRCLGCEQTVRVVREGPAWKVELP
jgi:hypothetical protein